MKTRKFFVSNSSSSSFICTIAVVRDEEKLKKFEEKIGEKLDRYTYEEICKNYRRGDFEDCLSKPNEKYKDCVFIHEYYMDDIEEDPDGETNYDADLDWFPDKQQEIFSADLEDGLEIVDQTYYAGRNG